MLQHSAYPAKPVRLLVGNATGGGIDLTAQSGLSFDPRKALTPVTQLTSVS